ncbi:hypothetical protein [Streptomyces sp. NPDC020917]
MTRTTRTRHDRRAVAAMHAGLGLTVLAKAAVGVRVRLRPR